MGLDNLMSLLEKRLEEAKLWKKIIEKPVIRKQSDVAKRVNEKIKQFAEAQINTLEKNAASLQKEADVKEFIDALVPVPKSSSANSAKSKKDSPSSKTAPPPKTTPHKDRKKQLDEQKESYPVHTGQMVKILTTQTLTAVNPQQLSKFSPEDEVKVARAYTNQFGEDVAEVIKATSDGLMKGVISLEDLDF